jgi:type I restriction enzyme R subunit
MPYLRNPNVRWFDVDTSDLQLMPFEEHEEHLTIHKLRTNEPLTATDLAELERMLIQNGVGSAEDLAKAKTKSNGSGLFVRSLVGMDRQAAKNALGEFLTGGNLRANQIQLLDEIVNHLTEHGSVEAGRMYESPYTDFSPQGVDGIFNAEQVNALIAMLEDLQSHATA